MYHVTSIKDLSEENISQLMNRTNTMKKRGAMHRKILDGGRMISLFYEPSTRTRHSFEAAMVAQGGTVIGTENAAQFSSAMKGETLEDTIRVESQYGHVLVLRHPEKGAAKRAAKVSSCPIINAGDGDGEHPTQALTDLFTILSKFSKDEPPRTVTFVGDLLRGRTVHSLAHLLPAVETVERVNMVAPDSMQIPKVDEQRLRDLGIKTERHNELTQQIVSDSDVIYMTRVQAERMVDAKGHSVSRLPRKGFILTKELASHMKERSIIMHPLPRMSELPPELDDLPQSVYFEQAKNGLLVRAALLCEIFQVWSG